MLVCSIQSYLEKNLTKNHCGYGPIFQAYFLALTGNVALQSSRSHLDFPLENISTYPIRRVIMDPQGLRIDKAKLDKETDSSNHLLNPSIIQPSAIGLHLVYREFAPRMVHPCPSPISLIPIII